MTICKFTKGKALKVERIAKSQVVFVYILVLQLVYVWEAKEKKDQTPPRVHYVSTFCVWTL